MKRISNILATLALLSISVPVLASETDSRIETSARQSYVFQTILQDDDIEIQSLDGAVTLTGVVEEESHRSLAQETVAGLPGVRSVDNRLEVEGDIPAEVPAENRAENRTENRIENRTENRTENTDAWLKSKVKSTLMFHRSVNGATTEVNVIHGIVILRGDANSQAQKDLTTEYARDIEGVKDVRNEMTVVKSANNPRTLGEKIDDASITAQVKMTLLYHRSTSALNTRVETNGGVVTLEGKAKNAAEMDLATKLAKDVYGVRDVSNRMTIE